MSLPNTFLLSPSALILAALGFYPCQNSKACCAVAGAGRQVVNADQTVVMLWDPKTKTQHFIRQASFTSDSEDVGFLVPTPNKPELEESGDSAFTELSRITAPVSRSGGIGFPLGCSKAASGPAYAVQVLERKRVAGFDATVLKAGSGDALVNWLAANDYAHSPQVAAWAEPYIARGWPFTALKVARATNDTGAPSKEGIDASALRITFQTDSPLFPYREPDSGIASRKLGASGRLLRIFFVSDASYEGVFENGKPWSGRKVWSGEITDHKQSLLKRLKLPSNTGPGRWWLTEFEDEWPYAVAPGDVIFVRSRDQSPRMRIARAQETDPLMMGMACLALVMLVRRKLPGKNLIRRTPCF